MSATITAAGRVAKADEVRQAGRSEVLNVRVAVDRGWGQNKTSDFFSLAIWGKQATSLAPYLVKGSYIVFTGEFGVKEYEYNGEKRVELVVNIDRIDLGPRSAAADDDRRAARDESQTVNGSQADARAAVTEELEDEIPF